MTVRITESMIKVTALFTGREAILRMSASEETIALTGKHKIHVIPIPRNPAISPSMMVSALNTRETSFLLAPMARRIPISFVRSRTLI